MKNSLIFLILTLLMASLGAAQVDYDIRANSDTTEVNTTILLECSGGSECPVNSWNLEWKIPENAELTKLSDSQGRIDDFERTGNTLQIETNRGSKRKTEKVYINYVDDSGPEEITPGLYRHRISLSAFPDEATSGELEAESLLSGRVSEGFRMSYSNDSMSFKGQGTGEVLFNFGNGKESDYYTFFGGKKNGSLAYSVAVGTTGLRQNYDNIPVVLLEESRYESSVSAWSQGEYSSGVIRIRKSLEDDFQPVLAEEVVHAFNSETLSFDKTSSTWLDEGIGSYTQSMVRRKLLGPTKMRQIFGNETIYIVERNGSQYEVTKPSTGDRDQLWNYYQQNQSFMKDWNPREVDSDTRGFGYAYSELIIRNYVAQGNKVSDLYSEIETDQTLETNQEKWEYLAQFLDLTPCRFESRQKFDQCLNRINSYDYKVYSATEIPEVKSESLDIEELETPNYTTMSSRNSYTDDNSTIILSELSNVLEDLISRISEIVYN